MTADAPAVSCTEIARPRLHITPTTNWMNDPNGLIFHDGRYHVYFQYNPHASDHGNMSWGHVSSADLLSWREHPVALWFDETEQVYSGSVVFDEHDTSGLGTPGHPPLVAVYTSARTDGIQAQSLAVSLDGGEVWEKFAGNPVLDRGSKDFRDPKVFRYEGRGESFWVMVAVEAAQHRVLFYRSDDLRTWSYLSDYGPAGAVGGVWECPDLFPLALDGDPDRVRWVLVISLHPGGPAGGSATQYVVGDFDGVSFTPDVALTPVGADSPDLATLDWVDAGPDCYAGVTFNGLPDAQRTFVAWMSNWSYAAVLPTADEAGWRGAMTLPRRLGLRTVDGRARLVATPALPPSVASSTTLPAGARLAGVLHEAARIDVETLKPGEVVVRLGDDGCLVEVVIDAVLAVVRVDRSAARPATGTMPVADRFEARYAAHPVHPVTIVVDNGSVEVFAGAAGGGSAVITALTALPPGPAIEVSTTAAARVAIGDLAPSPAG